MQAGGGVGGDDGGYDEHYISLLGALALRPHSMVISGPWNSVWGFTSNVNSCMLCLQCKLM